MLIRHYMMTLWLCLLVASGAAGADPVKVLIVDGFSNHDWKQTTAVVRRILEETQLFDIEVSTAPDTPDAPGWKTWRPQFGQYDVVIQNTNNIGKDALRWPAEMERALEDYVASGGGLYILHSANNAFAYWPQYDRMIGLGWRRAEAGTALEVTEAGDVIRIPPGEDQGTSHGPRRDTVVRVLHRHPINEGFPPYWKTPSLEVYSFARGPAEDLTILSDAFDETTQKRWPIEWVVQYGQGRVYNSTFGHLWSGEVEPDPVRCVGFQTTLIRAVQWLAAGKVTWPVPSDFPTKDEMSLREKQPSAGTVP